MKRMISSLLAAALALSPCIQAGAAEAPKSPPAAVQTVTNAAAKGQVDISVVSALTIMEEVPFTFSLTGQEAQVVPLASNKDSSVPTKAEASFGNLAKGTYTLEVTAPGFAPYKQAVEVEDEAYAVKLLTGYAAYEAGSAHPGVLRIGDVNGDGVVDDQDKKLLADAVDAGSTDKKYDLNGDGSVDLVDLEYFAKGSQEEIDAVAVSTIEVSVPASMIDVAPVEGTAITGGDVNSLLKNGGSIQLTRADGRGISERWPVEVTFGLDSNSSAVGGIVIDDTADSIKTGLAEITYTDADGKEQTVTAGIPDDGTRRIRSRIEAPTVTREAGGAICINLGSQVPVKKVTLKITGVKNNNNLAEISKVTFIGDMKNRIPEPSMDRPEGLAAEPGSASFTVAWNPCVNVTGYEVWIEGDAQQPKEEEGSTGTAERIHDVVQVTGNTLMVSSIGEEKLVNGKPYEVKVQSVNGSWRSGYCDSISVVPMATEKPDPPDYVKAAGAYRAINVNWKDMENTLTYNLYWKKDGDSEFTKVEGIAKNSYSITGLEDHVKYLVYVTGVNELGESGPSLTASAETQDITPAQMPRYKLLNKAQEGKVSPKIIAAQAVSGEMQSSPLDTEGKTAWGSVDNNYESYYLLNSWDGGGYNPVGGSLGNHGLRYEFDQPYKMDRIALQELNAQSPNYGYAKVCYWNEAGEAVQLGNVTIQRKTDAENRAYYLLRLKEPITAKKIQIGLARSVASGTITVSEVYFYHYDSLEADIMGLYADDLHTVLKEGVTQVTINQLRERINTVEEESGEYHPDKEMLERELKTAEDILNDELNAPARIHNSITTKDAGRGFGGLNAWQPLGVVAAAGEEITVYVGHNSKRTGDNTGLQLVATQYHAEAASMFKGLGNLKIGRNDITIPKIWSTDEESGGALYVQYTGNRANDEYAVRVSGGVEVPVLDLYHITDSSTRLQRTTEYVEKLENYVSTMEAKHNEVHAGGRNQNVKYDYSVQNCILGATDIMLDNMMFSLPAPQVLRGSGSGTAQQKAENILASMDAMEGMMNLFYQHKGLNNNAPNQIDQFPLQHQNIRYQRMFAGAFMYASGNHIGIEYNSAAGMVNCKSVQADEAGRWVSGNYFGWGIAHEIGHCINQGAYAVAEITNNYFAVLAQAKETNDSVRFKYDEVYKKVTSNTKGRANNVFTQLGMYWQLHLAYDSGYNFKTYEDYNEQLANLFFARVDHYARTPANAPKPGNVTLTLSGDKDQQLMRLSCAAAEKNILDFFIRWGMEPDADTQAYADQFPVETRAIYYVNDEARAYRVENSGSVLGTEGAVAAVADGTTAVVNASAANQVDFTLNSVGIPENDILGYEITRCTTSGGEESKQVVGFTTQNTFTDTISTLNNRVVTYEVTLIDKYLNRSAAKRLAPVKIEHEGNIDKSNWSVAVNGIEATNLETIETDEYIPCPPEEEDVLQKTVRRMIDNDQSTAYTGVVGTGAEIILNFNQTHAVTGLKYAVSSGTPISGYEISVQEENGQWTKAAEGDFANGNTVYFGNGANIAIYKAQAVKLALTGQSGTEIAISELDVFGVTGDNVDFRRTEDGGPVIGKLAAEYLYNDGQDSIPANSIVFTGSYKGNPAYNVVILYDQDGNIVGGTGADGSLNASQIVFADVPVGAQIQDVHNGTWIYWIEPQDNIDLSGLKQVRAELYRVDNAETNEGQRMVSDSYLVDVPQELPTVTIDGSQAAAASLLEPDQDEDQQQPQEEGEGQDKDKGQDQQPQETGQQPSGGQQGTDTTQQPDAGQPQDTAQQPDAGDAQETGQQPGDVQQEDPQDTTQQPNGGGLQGTAQQPDGVQQGDPQDTTQQPSDSQQGDPLDTTQQPDGVQQGNPQDTTQQPSGGDPQDTAQQPSDGQLQEPGQAE